MPAIQNRVASTRNETVSQTARRMLLDGLATPSSTEEAIARRSRHCSLLATG